MGRPSLSDPHAHLTGELAQIVGLRGRRNQTLRDEKRGPYRNPAAATLAAGGLHSEDTISHLAITMALEAAGVNLRVAAEIPSAFFDTNPNHPPAAFSNLHGFTKLPPANGEWFANFCTLWQQVEGFERLAKPIDGDALLHIANGQWVLDSQRNPRLKIEPEPVGTMLDMTNPDLAFVPAWNLTDYADAEAVERCRREYREALDEAKTVLTVNLSLTIRLAFLRAWHVRLDTGREMPTPSSDANT